MKAAPRSVRALAAVVVRALAEEGVEAVLTGGAVVSLYTNNAYESKDLDFVCAAGRERVERAMASIGFRREGRSFVREGIPFTVEFPTGPLALGEHVGVRPAGRLRVGATLIRLLSPAQCVMDRLAWFFHNRDRQCLDQAVAVASSQAVSLDAIRRWARGENDEEGWTVFLEALKRS
ncbi:MAG: hypothetical protein AUJ52_13235 [Elusimicrobia bacterium CG1_02_63_36]|nr:MAG: hypothetical protein AUJ52_13235 [Elusimicrobia bacterium CG1_02_63_36]PIP83345.1 MAG: hypothetical protein COR54_10070 [Elusimicrobia bacterium CG22_combo_CG10-13_8_21_14_all_63_91]PJA17996.1 MAG: hypothetical protein COX66_02600 [Elusimicrobia bacterium CG_4_10_14_0_2_um_filter_63_34]PJB24216.1 MAG: hypothetical protein CO113_14915 [Elusimicrobia bacterium CG_4_9_14_3_um_filter_62_55]